MSVLVNPYVFGTTPPPPSASFLSARGAGANASSTLNGLVPVGAVAGDVMGIILYVNGSSSAALTATMTGSGTVLSATMGPSSGPAPTTTLAFYSRILSSSDISNGNIAGTNSVALANFYIFTFIYRGISTITPKVLDGSSATTYTASGFAPAGGSLGAVTAVLDTSNSTPTPPAGWTLRAVSAAGFASFDLGDQLSGYINASTVWTAYSSSTSRNGFIMELT